MLGDHNIPALLERMRPLASRLCRRRAHDPDDLLQEVAVRLLRSLREADAKQLGEGAGYQLLLWTAGDQQRRAESEARLTAALMRDARARDERSPLDLLITQELVALVRAGLRELRAHERDALVERYYHETRRLGVVMKQRVCRARNRCRRIIDDPFRD